MNLLPEEELFVTNWARRNTRQRWLGVYELIIRRNAVRNFRQRLNQLPNLNAPNNLLGYLRNKGVPKRQIYQLILSYFFQTRESQTRMRNYIARLRATLNRMR